MDRQLTVEFPWLLKEVELPLGGSAQYIDTYSTDTRAITNRVYVQESKIDLSGYVQSDLTVGFRRSFEQKAGTDFFQWYTYNPNVDYILETVIISSVPMNDAQLTATLVGSPGFTNFPNPGLEWGNFNREHIIHGSYKVHYANSIVGSGAFTSTGASTLVTVVDNIFSSLEPTAADCLYCYRVINLPNPVSFSEGPKTLQMPAMRVILDAFTVEEPQLEYMMRLKRSYELANQV